MLSPMSILLRLVSAAMLSLISMSCTEPAELPAAAIAQSSPTPAKIEKLHNNVKVIHVLVALCDNINQGIVPVSARLGNGQDPTTNLYWGAAFGVKTFFSKSQQWTKILDVQ